MSGIFGVISEEDCVKDLFYGTDYHSHLGTKRGGLAVLNDCGIQRRIHNIENSQFRSKFEEEILDMHGFSGIGVISDYEDQPLNIGSHLGNYSIVSVNKINNIDQLIKKFFGERAHFVEMSGNKINPTEVISGLVDKGENFLDGIINVQELIEGSCTLIILHRNGLYVARDKFGRTPLIIGKKAGSYAVASESCVFSNLNFDLFKELGPGEIGLLTSNGYEQLKKPREEMQICSFLWVYYGNPASIYEGIPVENVRYNCGIALAKRDNVLIDYVAGIPDSGVAHAIGYSNEKGVKYSRPLIKYVQTWQRSFMPQEQGVRDIVAKMKIIPVKSLIEGKKILFCDDSIVRGTQLKEKVDLLLKYGAKEVHVRPACPPLTHGCKFLGFSRSKSEQDLAARRAIEFLEPGVEITPTILKEYSNPDSEKYHAMVEVIRKNLGATSLMYQRLDDLIKAIGLPKEKLCTYCWDGVDCACMKNLTEF